MLIRDFHYLEQNGYHLPDTPFGSERRYAVDYNCWFHNELITDITSVTWKCVNHLTRLSGNEFTYTENDQTNHLAIIAFVAPCRGTYRLECTIAAESNGVTLTKVIPLALKVY